MKPGLQLSEEDMRELWEPDDLAAPDWPSGRPVYVIVIDQIRGLPGQPPSLAEVLETGRTREPEPDLEAEP